MEYFDEKSVVLNWVSTTTMWIDKYTEYVEISVDGQYLC